MSNELNRTEAILAQILLQLMGSHSQAEKVHSLSRAGFSNLEIANMLETTTATISQTLYEKRKSKKKR